VFVYIIYVLSNVFFLMISALITAIQFVPYIRSSGRFTFGVYSIYAPLEFLETKENRGVPP
jgi:hypothetical protein